ncbi:MAG: Spy/CpxP family protein refolding chaperone [Acidobacteriota bacterium]|nr:MAG: Spy/CpxP family protein refolding chaperone [Acidobacteriota bacterium]
MKSSGTIFFFILMTLSFGAVHSFSQQGNMPNDRPNIGRQAGPPQDIRANMLRRLGLTSEQVVSLRKMNAERLPKTETAQLRLRQANRSLDEAIYADSFSQELYETRLREVQNAQAEVTRLRFEGELAIRKVLTSEQLTRFKEMRERFEQLRPQPGPMRPMPGPGMRGPMRGDGPKRQPPPEPPDERN